MAGCWRTGRKVLGWGCLVVGVLLVLLFFISPLTLIVGLGKIGELVPKPRQIDKHTDGITWSADGKRLYYWRDEQGKSCVLYRYDLAAKQRTWLMRDSKVYTPYALSPDERHLLWIGNALRLVDVPDGQQRELFRARKEYDYVSGAQWRTDGGILFSVSEGRQQRVYTRTADGRPEHDFQLPRDAEPVLFSPDGNCFGYRNGAQFTACDTRTGRPLNVVSLPGDGTDLLLTRQALYLGSMEYGGTNYFTITRLALADGSATKISHIRLSGNTSYFYLSPDHIWLAVVYHGGGDWYNSEPGNLCVYPL